MERLLFVKQWSCPNSLANCLHLYTGLELKGVRPTIIMHIDDLGMNKILPFTYLTSVLNEDNE
jgi:hypothetical protein